jgi:hypothetical protein
MGYYMASSIIVTDKNNRTLPTETVTVVSDHVGDVIERFEELLRLVGAIGKHDFLMVTTEIGNDIKESA